MLKNLIKKAMHPLRVTAGGLRLGVPVRAAGAGLPRWVIERVRFGPSDGKPAP